MNRSIKRRHGRCRHTNTKRNLKKQRGGDIAQIENIIIDSMANLNIRTTQRTIVTQNSRGIYAVDFACSKFRIDYNQMVLHIAHLTKCGQLSGTNILKCIITIGELLHMNSITLYDVSTINKGSDCEYSLCRYYILLTGESWYNSFGFVSDDHDKNKLFNKSIRNMKLNDFVTNGRHYNYIIGILKDERYDIYNLTVHDAIKYLTYVMKNKNASCRNDYSYVLIAIKHIVDASEKQLYYNAFLQLKL